jgi:acyl carrier protein
VTTTESIREVLATVALAPLPADDSASLFEEGVIDSFALLNLVSRLEKSMGVSFAPADIVPRRFDTVAKIAALVTARQR